MSGPQSLSPSQTHLVLFILVLDLEGLGGPDHGLHGGEDVLVHQLGEASFVLVSVARPMDDAHLFDECALATFASA